MRQVWIDFGDCEVVEFSFESDSLLDGFLRGIKAAGTAWGCRDCEVFNEEPHEAAVEGTELILS